VLEPTMYEGTMVLEGYRQDNCLFCYNDSPGYAFCNSQNETGYCCPFGSTLYSCIPSDSNNITCSYEEGNSDLFFSYCLQPEWDQCGSAGKYLNVKEGLNASVDIDSLSWDNATTCLWQILADESKRDIFYKNTVVEFEIIENTQVQIITGFQRSGVETTHPYAVVGKKYRFAFYN